MKNDNPLNLIFIKQGNGKLSDEISDIKNINLFFNFLKDEKINNDSKIKVIDELKKKIETNRFISEFFSQNENKSIYLHLFDLFTKKNSSDKLRTSILSLIEELCLNIETGKEVYEYIFQNLSKIYRNELNPTAENVLMYLKLLKSVLCETDNIKNPKNYFTCDGGNCKFNVDLKEKPLDIEYSFSININFKISKNYDQKRTKEINLIKLYFSNNQTFSVDLKLPGDLIIKDIQKDPIRKLGENENEWNNLIITIAHISNSLNIFINLNGENESTKLKITTLSLNFDDSINNIEFFNNFVGEVTSIYMFSQMDPGLPMIITRQFLSELKKYREGLWNKKIINSFRKFLKTIPSVDFKSKSVYFKSTKLDKKDEKKLYDNLIFMFTPINYYKDNPNIVESVYGKYKLRFSGNIKNHLYQNYQKKLFYVCELSNFFPIAEMFLIYPETLNEQNFEIFLKIIYNMLNYRKQNLKSIKKYKFFNILSMFFEKYPQKIFTSKILDSFFELGKILFIFNLEAKCSNYFKHILLNEKILSKYDSNLQNEFWNKLFLFYESDKTQVETFLNINRLCLILRFYDRNKYTEMCCTQHLNMIKDEYKGSTKVMEPSMSQKLSNLKNLMDSIIDSQEPKNAISLFKLLTLDLSPCLVKFILNIFINAFKTNKSEEWNNKFVSQLLQTKFEVIVINTFIHSLPDIRIDLLKFVFQIHLRLISTGSTSKFNIFEKMLKTCLLPDNKFSTKNINKIPGMHIANPPKKKGDEKEDPKNNEQKTEKSNTSKSNFAALLSKFNTPKPSSNTTSNTNNFSTKNSLKPNEIQKKVEKNENPFIKSLKPVPSNLPNEQTKKSEDKNKIVNKIKEEKKPIVSKINEEKKSVANKINEEKKPIVSKINEEKKPIANKINEEKKPIANKISEEFKNKINKLNDEKKPVVNKINEDIKNKQNKPNEEKRQENKFPALKPMQEQKEIEPAKNRTYTMFVHNRNIFENNNNMAKKNIFEKSNNFSETRALFETKKPAVIKPSMPEKKNEININSSLKNTFTEKQNNNNSNNSFNFGNKNIFEQKFNNSINNNNSNNKVISKTNTIDKDKDKNKDNKNIVSNINKTEKEKEKEKQNINEPKNFIKPAKPINNNTNIPYPKINDIYNNNLLAKNDTIIKDNEINDYINKLYSIFILWSTATDIESNLNDVNFDNCDIKFKNAIEIIFLLNKGLKDKKYIINFFEIINKLITNPENCYELFFDKKLYSSFLDITFDCFKKNTKEEKECFNLGKNILVTLFINSFICCEQHQNLNPGNEVETLFLWGDNIFEENYSKEKSALICEFFYELFFEFLLQFKLKFEARIKFDLIGNDLNFKNYILKNYLMLMTEIFNFSFRFKIEKDLHYKGLSIVESKNDKIEIPGLILSSMRIKDKNINSISQDWLDFPLIYDIFNRYKFIWVKNNVYKNLEVDNYKKEKSSKYDFIIENFIVNKEKKNLYLPEIFLLCYEDKKADYDYIIPLIQIIPYTIMCIIEKLKASKNEKDFLDWVKDLKCFIRFVIIASSNLLKQIESYKKMQDKCLEIITSGIYFMKNLYENTPFGKAKIQKSLASIVLLCLKLLKWNYDYKIEHSKIINKIVKKGANDISNSATILLFNEYIKDIYGNPLLTKEKLDLMSLDDNNKCISEVIKLIESNEFKIGFTDNRYIKSQLLNGFFSLDAFKKIVDYRYELMPCLQETYDESYKKVILNLLPQYENELAKYSNNSLEKNIRNKNKYKSFKKNAFSWRGYWSCRQNFFTDKSPFKYKVINHYTKNFMKPILMPILDISYYLPEFTGFDINNLFRKQNKENKINLDIDKVLIKSSETNMDESNKEKIKDKKKENYLVNIYKKSNLTLYEKYKKIANNLEFGKEEEFAYIERGTNDKEENANTKKYFLCCLVKTSHHIKGVCFIDDNNLNFKVFLNQKTGNAMSGVEIAFTTEDDDYDKDRQTCFGSYFICHPKDKDLYKISINYNDIKWIFRRKYYYTNSAFEIYTTTNKTFYFNFKIEDDREIVINEILKKIQGGTPIIDDLKEGGNTVVGYENKIHKKKKEKIKLSEIIKKWKNWEINNFEFLMWLNIFGNRSYNDISQYPVFPWVLSKYEDPLKEKVETSDDYDYQYRDMNLPMGMMELDEKSIKRKESFLETYETLKEEPNEGVKPYIFGTNYSNPFYVCYYLIRLFPFSHISIELQGKKFDNANRLFFSINNTFKNSIIQKTDVKELIPEFFYLPEMFINLNELSMGTLDTGNLVDNVQTPCNNNPYDFIMTMKSILESNKLSYTLQNWADLVFGYKARGKEAENAYNIYTEASYQENIDINKVENKEAYLRLVEFGLIPNQIMTKECVKRDKKESILKGKEITDSTSDLIHYSCKPHNDKDKQLNHDLIVLNIGCFSQDKILVCYNNNSIHEKKINISALNKTYSYEDININEFFKISNKMSKFYNPKHSNSKVVHFCQKGKLIIFGGFYDGKVQIFPLSSKLEPIILSPFRDNLPIVSIAVDKEEEFAFFGNTLGNVNIVKMDKDPFNFQFYDTITHQMSAISYIDCNSNLNLWASGSVDGYINLYTLPLSKLIRIIKVPSNNLEYVFLAESPLPTIIAITEENGVSEIFVYSINGKSLLRQKESDIINCPLMIRDMNTNNYLAYILNDTVVIRSIPNLIREVCIEGMKNLYAICPSEDMKTLYGINKNGNEIYVIKEEKEKN